MTHKEAYELVKSVARPSDAEGLKKERAILLLWFLRNVLGIDDLEAYEYVCDGDNDKGVDGLFMEDPDVDDDAHTLTVFQSRYPLTPKNVGETDLKGLVGTAEQFQTASSVRDLLSGELEPELRALVQRFKVEDRLDAGELQVRMTLVTAGILSENARSYIDSVNAKRGAGTLRAYDALDLAPIIKAFRSPTTVTGDIEIACPRGVRFSTTVGADKVTVAAVPAMDIVQWPGIADRSLFDLNVRQELRRNRVRKALDRAIQREVDHPSFLAYHNGLTVVCSNIDDSDAHVLRITDISVVNGAQSTIAFKDNEGHLTPELRVVVKFVQVDPEQQLAREVAIRSNTQNPVNARNLRARDGIQLRLEQEFKHHFPGIEFVTRPDATRKTTSHQIQNDDAAQLISAILNEQPWIAIRRLSLFEASRYPTVFTPDITAAHVVMVDLIAERVQAGKQRFPSEYLRSWRLTKLVAAYLVGQLFRTSDELMATLESPADALSDRRALESRIDRLVRFAAAAMQRRRDRKERERELDDFKVDFKREQALRDLAGEARDQFLTYQTVED